MPTLNDVRQSATPFDSFLYAAVGDDQNGNSVTVLSALARLGLEPWDAASDLADLSREEARARLGGLLARCRDVPALGGDNATVAQRLIDLLPMTSGRQASRAVKRLTPRSVASLGPKLAILLAILYLANALFFGSNLAMN